MAEGIESGFAHERPAGIGHHARRTEVILMVEANFQRGIGQRQSERGCVNGENGFARLQFGGGIAGGAEGACPSNQIIATA